MIVICVFDGDFPMKRAVLYLRISTTDQTTANQERELREIAERAGWEVVKVYKDHGISGAKGRDKRPAFDALCRDARSWLAVVWSGVDQRKAVRCRYGLVGRSSRPQPARLNRPPVRVARLEGRFIPQIAGNRHHDAGWQGDVPDDGRVRRVRAVHHSGTSPRWA